MTPYYRDDSCVIYHGDCRDTLPELLDGSAMVTDPPYGLQMRAFADQWEPVSALDSMPSSLAAIFMAPTRIWNLAALLPSWKLLRPLWMHKTADIAPAGLANRGGWFCNSEAIVLAMRSGTRWPKRPPTYRTDLYNVGPWERTGTHPTEKPLDVVRDLVHRLATDGRLVFDPFMGTGTTLRAAKDLGLRAIGIEIDERYCEVAARRLAQGVLAL